MSHLKRLHQNLLLGSVQTPIKLRDHTSAGRQEESERKGGSELSQFRNKFRKRTLWNNTKKMGFQQSLSATE